MSEVYFASVLLVCGLVSVGSKLVDQLSEIYRGLLQG